MTTGDSYVTLSNIWGEQDVTPDDNCVNLIYKGNKHEDTLSNNRTTLNQDLPLWTTVLSL